MELPHRPRAGAARARARIAAVPRETGIAPHAVAGIVGDLERAGYMRRQRGGGMTLAVVDHTRPLDDPAFSERPVGRLVDAVQPSADVLRDRIAVAG
jgi:hypothetical protein